MRIAICGGTGNIGEGLALRWGFDTEHEILIGSRDPEKARTKAAAYETELDSRGVERTIKGFVNEMAADRADVVVVAVPPYYVDDTIDAIADRLDEDTVLVSPAVGMQRDDDGLHYHPPPEGSVTELARATAPSSVPVVGAYHSLPADRLANLDASLDMDTVILGDDDDAVEIVSLLTKQIEGLRPIYGGSLANASEVESITPLLVNIAAFNADLHDVGVRFV